MPEDDVSPSSPVSDEVRADVVKRVARETSTDPEIIEHVVEVVRQEFHRGPLPTPETFGQYEAICPGAASEILQMAVRAQTHSHDMDRTALSSEADYRKLAIVLAASLVALMIVGAILCAVTDHNGAAVALGGAAGLASVAGVFIRGRNLFGTSSDSAVETAEAAEPEIETPDATSENSSKIALPKNDAPQPM